MSKSEDDRIFQQIANAVFKNHNTTMIQMLKNSIKLAVNKHEKRAYQNVIDYVAKLDKERIEKIESQIKPESKIITLND